MIRGVDPKNDEPQGSKAVAGGIAGLATTWLAFMPWLLVLIGWLFVSGYAIWKLVSGGSDEPSAGVMLGGFMAIVALLALGLAGGIWAVGRGFAPKRRSEN